MKWHTLAVHAGTEPDPLTGAVMTPVYFTSTYAQEAPGVHKGYEYSRTHNPTRTALETALAQLEGAKHGIAFASGLAATDAILRLLNPGDHVLVSRDLYGGTYRIMRRVFEPWGLKFDFVDTTDPAVVEAAIRPETKMLWIETPSNPLLYISPIAALADLAHAHGIRLVVDNTFATPYLQAPLEMGADIVVHSATKYLGGHSDVVMGAVMLNDDEDAQRLRFIQNAVGAVPGPMDCFLVLRGIKTLPLRMQKHSENAQKISEFLATHPKVSKVYYPGLVTHPQYLLAKQQMRLPGGMISFEVKINSIEDLKNFWKSLQIFTLAESLGGVESLINHPAVMTHASIPETERLALGITPGLLRLSVGIEDADDLVSDLKAALQRL
ncbi:MAG: cystathionine gamma-synthase [Bacteroidia bacterium]|nr:cystathionine gamma-synthase [Bacteroidia bacterium]MCX7764551.1 cystathionine gamma-synthase [Bacteroidia bacterium]MDW8058290.1 cystathionine gamma-synthase [Bacteroidia bacterium]